MTMMKERAVELIKKMPDERIYYLLHMLEDMEALLNGDRGDALTESQTAFQELQKYRKPRMNLIDDKAELHKAWEEKYAGVN